MGNALAEVVLDAADLGWLAETADGTRDVEFILVKDASGVPQLRETSKPLEPGDKIATEIKVKTTSSLPSPGKKRKRVLEVTCIVEDWSQPATLPSANKWDAVFWTESSIKKFLYPYYHSQRLWSKQMADLEEEFDKDHLAVAIAHRAPSKSSRVDRGVNTLGVGRQTLIDRVPEFGWPSAAEYVRERKGRQ